MRWPKAGGGPMQDTFPHIEEIYSWQIKKNLFGTSQANFVQKLTTALHKQIKITCIKK